MVIRIARFEKAPVAEWKQADGFRDWMASQPGFVKGYRAIDPATGEGISISTWDSMEEVRAMKGRTESAF